MYYEDDDEGHWMGPRQSARSARVFLSRSDDNQSNIAAWKKGVASARAGDAAGVLEALLSARGSLMPFNTRGSPARNPCAKAVLALKERPDAWRRLKEAASGGYRSSETPEAEWAPSAVSVLDYLWAESPRAVAQAAALWRQGCEENGKWWSSPFLNRPYEGGFRLPNALGFAASRCFEPQEYRFSRLSEPEPIVPMPTDDAERAALTDTLVELARACLDELWTHASRARESRASNKTVWSRGGSEMGLNWRGAGAPIELASQEGSAPVTVAERAAERAMAEALAAGEAQGDLACCKWAVGPYPLLGAYGSSASVALSMWAKARPDCETGLPFDAFDWLPPERLFGLCEQAGVSDQALGRWLAGPGARWSQPAGFNYQGQLIAQAPSWSYERSSPDPERWMEGMDQWGPLEWALKYRPQAAREACLLGALLAPGVEEVFASAEKKAGRGSAASDYAIAQAWGQACRLAQVAKGPAPGAFKRSLSI